MADDSEWIEWAGGECPVPSTALVDIRVASGDTCFGMAAKTWGNHGIPELSDWWAWSCDEGNRINAYRLVQS